MNSIAVQTNAAGPRAAVPLVRVALITGAVCIAAATTVGMLTEPDASKRITGLGAAMLVWLVALPFNAPVSRTHDWVTRLSLQMSGREQPYTRRAMHLEAQQEMRRTSTRPAPPRRPHPLAGQTT